MLDTSNELRGNYYKNYQTYQLGKAVKQIPPERRKSLAEEILARANVMGCKDENALKVALKLLGKEKP